MINKMYFSLKTDPFGISIISSPELAVEVTNPFWLNELHYPKSIVNIPHSSPKHTDTLNTLLLTPALTPVEKDHSAISCCVRGIQRADQRLD